MCSLFLASKDRVAYGLQMSFCLRAVVVVGLTAPEGLFIELDFLDVRTSIDHRTKMGITNRQSLQPVRSWLCIP